MDAQRACNCAGNLDREFEPDRDLRRTAARAQRARRTSLATRVQVRAGVVMAVRLGMA
jgi:hypothetical protein